MKMTTSWAFASAAVVAILVAGCTTETADNSEGGVTTGTAGSSAAGSAGSGGASTGGSGGGTGGSSSDSDAGPEPMSVCETCAYAKCKTEGVTRARPIRALRCASSTLSSTASARRAPTKEVAGSLPEPNPRLRWLRRGRYLAGDLASCMTDTD